MADDQPRVGIVHATALAMAPIQRAFAAHLPRAVTLNFLDEGLLDGLNQTGQITPGLIRRLATVVGLAESAGVNIILMSCSAYSPVVETIRTLTSMPVVPIDGVLIEEAVSAGTWLGVVATGARSASTITRALEAEAARREQPLAITAIPVPAAFAALGAGDPARHDEIVTAAARSLAEDGVEAVVLAQASMSRALPAIGDLRVPVLTSPLLAVNRVIQVLGLHQQTGPPA